MPPLCGGNQSTGSVAHVTSPEVKVSIRDDKAAKGSQLKKMLTPKKVHRVDEEGLNRLLSNLPTTGSPSAMMPHLNHGLHLTRQQRERLLTAFEGVVCIIFAVVLCILFLYGVTTTRPLCRTEVCRSYAQLLFEMLNVSVSPCEDFYSHVCSRWHAKHFYAFKESIYLMFIQRVSDRNLHTYIPTQGQSAVQKAAQFYQSCTNIYVTGGDRELKIVKQLLADFGVFWPRLDNASNLLRTCFAMSAVLDWSPVILFSLVRPGHILMAPASFYAFLLGRRGATLHGSNEGREYKHYFRHMVDTFLQPGPLTGVLSYDELLAIESQVVPVLQEAYNTAEGGRIKNGTFDDVLELSGEAIPRSRWEVEIRDNFKYAASNHTFVVDNVFFFSEFFALVRNLSESRMAYYLGWAAVQGMSLLTKRQIINFYYPTRSKAFQRHVVACASLSHHYMGLAFYANYIREQFSAHDVADVRALVRYVHNFLHDGFSSTEALKELIEKSLQSLDQTTEPPSATSAPLSFVSDSEERQLNELFQNFPDLTTNIFDNIKSIAAARRMTAADTRTASFRWNGTIHFYYFTEEKRFELLPIALEPPLYNAEAPPAVKYGALGAQIGDAMAALLFRRLRDADEDTQTRVYTEALCQRSQPTIPVQTEMPQRLGWPNISKREIAERVVSLDIIFEAFLYATNGNDQFRLEGYESLTEKRMFFVFWCMTQCGSYDGKHRCNDPLRFFQHFATAFECKVGTHMYTRTDCSV